MEATRKAVAAATGTSGNRRRRLGHHAIYTNSHSNSSGGGYSIHSRGIVPLLQGCKSLDSLDYQPLEPLVTSSSTAPSRRPDEATGVFAEDWLFGGANDSTSTLSSTPLPKDRVSEATPPTTGSMSDDCSHAFGTSKERSRSSSRGRSLLRPILPPPLWESPQRQQRQQRQRKARSLEPRRRFFRRILTSEPKSDVFDQARNTSASTSSAVPPTNPANCGIVTTETVSATIPIVGIPIPDDYVDCIIAAFGPNVDLYRDVLKVDDSFATPAKLRVAYFRQGRHVLQGGKSVASVTEVSVVSPKQRFQAVTRAYEILTHSAWKAFYDAHGLRLASHPVVVPASVVPSPPLRFSIQALPLPTQSCSNADDLDALSVYSGTSAHSGQSILRRSNSWGPTRSRSTSRSRVCWSERVEELVFQPDPLNSSGDTKELEGYLNRPRKSKKAHCVIDSPELTEDLEKLDSRFRRDFLDDLEANLDGLEAKIGGFVQYALSKETDKDQSGETSPGEEKKCDDNSNEDKSGGLEVDDNSSIARQLFSEMTAPTPTTDFPTDFSAFNTTSSGIRTNSAPMKEANNGQPRVIPRKKKHKLKVDRVPTEQEIKESRGAKMIVEVFEDPVDSKVNASKGWNVQDVIASVANLLGAGSTSDATSRANTDTVSSPASYFPRNKPLQHYDLQSNSSILASLAETASNPEQGNILVGKAPELETGLDFGVVNTLSFAEALNMSTDATTKGFVRVDRHTSGTEASQSPLDTSDLTYLSKTTAELMPSNMPDCFGDFAKQARETLREVGSMDEADVVVRAVGTDNKAPSPAESSEGATFLSSIGTYFNSFMNDVQGLGQSMHTLGQSIGTNLGEANRTVVETMSFTDDEVDGMLKVLESELSAPHMIFVLYK